MDKIQELDSRKMLLRENFSEKIGETYNKRVDRRGRKLQILGLPDSSALGIDDLTLYPTHFDTGLHMFCLANGRYSPMSLYELKKAHELVMACQVVRKALLNNGEICFWCLFLPVCSSHLLLYIYLLSCLIIYLFIYLSSHCSIYLSIVLFIYLLFYLSIYCSIDLFIVLFICQS